MEKGPVKVECSTRQEHRALIPARARAAQKARSTIVLYLPPQQCFLNERSANNERGRREMSAERCSFLKTPQ